jgi:hypothetical protein
MRLGHLDLAVVYINDEARDQNLEPLQAEEQFQFHP